MSGTSTVLPRVILLLNAAILVVNFVLVLSGTETQADLMRASGGSGAVRVTRTSVSAVEVLKLVNSLEAMVSAPQLEALGPEQILAIQRALEHYRGTVEVGVSSVLYDASAGTAARARMAELSKQARDEVQVILGAAIRDDALVNQITTAVLRFA